MKYSVHKINTAGNTALTSNNIDEVNHALDIIKDWRTSHLPALDELQNLIVPLLKDNKVNIYSVSISKLLLGYR